MSTSQLNLDYLSIPRRNIHIAHLGVVVVDNRFDDAFSDALTDLIDEIRRVEIRKQSAQSETAAFCALHVALLLTLFSAHLLCQPTSDLLSRSGAIFWTMGSRCSLSSQSVRPILRVLSALHNPLADSLSPFICRLGCCLLDDRSSHRRR